MGVLIFGLDFPQAQKLTPYFSHRTQKKDLIFFKKVYGGFNFWLRFSASSTMDFFPQDSEN